jgi:hypothetical protein
MILSIWSYLNQLITLKTPRIKHVIKIFQIYENVSYDYPERASLRFDGRPSDRIVVEPKDQQIRAACG